jgi:hypothetical protein
LSIYFGRGQRSRQKFGHCGSKLTFCGGLLLRDFRSASSTTWYSLRLEAGQLDASSGYLSAATSHHLPFIALLLAQPPEGP